MSVRRGFTLIETLIAVTLVALLSTAMLVSIRVALNAQASANTRLMSNRRVVGAQNALEQEINGFVPARAAWTTENGSVQRGPFFGGDEQNLHLVSSFSLNAANRGLPQVLDFRIVPGENGEGARLIVNESPYHGVFSAQNRVAGEQRTQDGQSFIQFFPVEPGPGSFVLADRLAYCRFVYEALVRVPQPHTEWTNAWTSSDWPVAIRVEMAPLDASAARLHPMTVTAELHASRAFNREYHDNDSL